MLNSHDLINKVKVYNKFLNLERLDKAFNFAIKAHQNQKRASGDPYSVHPIDNEIYFSNLKKFDGKKTRRLNLIEMSQIAGRAGRFKNDGGFGTTGDCENLNSDEIKKKEKHDLPDTKVIFWRNSKLNFESPDKLITSLELKPSQKNLLRTNDSLDESVLRHFLKKGANNIIYHKNL